MGWHVGSARPRVLSTSAARVHVEAGETVDLTATGKVAVVAQHGGDARISRSLSVYLRELVENGYRCLVMSTSPALTELVWPEPLPVGVTVARRSNSGYDFGSWAVALETYPQLAGLECVVLTNDSMVGPFTPLAPLLSDLERTRADVWTLTDSWQIAQHFQSYFMGFRGGILAESPLRSFFRGVRMEPTKMDVVRRYELGLSRACVGEGYSLTARFRSHDLMADAMNPTLAAWQQLLSRGFPFVKRTLVLDPASGIGAARIAHVIRSRFDENIEDWL